MCFSYYHCCLATCMIVCVYLPWPRHMANLKAISLRVRSRLGSSSSPVLCGWPWSLRLTPHRPASQLARAQVPCPTTTDHYYCWCRGLWLPLVQRIQTTHGCRGLLDYMQRTWLKYSTCILCSSHHIICTWGILAPCPPYSAVILHGFRNKSIVHAVQ